VDKRGASLAHALHRDAIRRHRDTRHGNAGERADDKEPEKIIYAVTVSPLHKILFTTHVRSPPSSVFSIFSTMLQ